MRLGRAFVAAPSHPPLPRPATATHLQGRLPFCGRFRRPPGRFGRPRQPAAATSCRTKAVAASVAARRPQRRICRVDDPSVAALANRRAALVDLVSPPRPQVAERKPLPLLWPPAGHSGAFAGSTTDPSVAARRPQERICRVDDPSVAALWSTSRPLWSTPQPASAGGDAPKSVRERAAAITEKRSRKSGGDAEKRPRKSRGDYRDKRPRKGRRRLPKSVRERAGDADGMGLQQASATA